MISFDRSPLFRQANFGSDIVDSAFILYKTTKQKEIQECFLNKVKTYSIATASYKAGGDGDFSLFLL